LVESAYAMCDLPFLYQGIETPAEQVVVPGAPTDYVAVLVIHGKVSWIAIELVRRHLAFGRVERWHPILECTAPAELQRAFNSAGCDARYFNIWFRGVPSEKDRYGEGGLCLREVRIVEISEIREGRVPPYER
jgi:hypothetical protein